MYFLCVKAFTSCYVCSGNPKISPNPEIQPCLRYCVEEKLVLPEQICTLDVVPACYTHMLNFRAESTPTHLVHSGKRGVYVRIAWNGNCSFHVLGPWTSYL